MVESRPPRRKRWVPLGTGALAVAVLSLVVAAPSYADLRPPARPRGVPPMRFVRVTSAEASCKPNCPEWLSAEGRIEPGSAKIFADAIGNLKGRRLPILIHSPGGSVVDAAAMGEVIREKGLAVAVARTLIANCPETSAKCPDGPGAAITGGAICASACVLVLAGGAERLAGPPALIGVHQITTVVSETEGLAHLKSTRKIYEQRGVDAAVEAYLTAMGVGEPVMSLMRKTWAASIRWMSPAELKASHLATAALDPTAPMLETGANGLNGRAFESDASSGDPMQATFTKPIAEDSATLGVVFRYRRGGGVVEAETVVRGLEAPRSPPPLLDLSLASSTAGIESVRLWAAARALIPRERFCALARSGGAIALVTPDKAQGFDPIELISLDGARALIAEACP